MRAKRDNRLFNAFTSRAIPKEYTCRSISVTPIKARLKFETEKRVPENQEDYARATSNFCKSIEIFAGRSFRFLKIEKPIRRLKKF